ncbi:hypothetical protein [Spiroplasma alleghenense]|uniref:Lipoprotein n=1 Tax=Spiroplasma alleghenense TaxID=216931 RepID=A0A345Z4I0_9MOLU|nr:hypothetical protein [Spiroplasma alleghenense]AXK51509.1 hypothetical protein SALLE_v1c08390 [Spiroplasma alleghenense]
MRKILKLFLSFSIITPLPISVVSCKSSKKSLDKYMYEREMGYLPDLKKTTIEKEFRARNPLVEDIELEIELVYSNKAYVGPAKSELKNYNKRKVEVYFRSKLEFTSHEGNDFHCNFRQKYESCFIPVVIANKSYDYEVDEIPYGDKNDTRFELTHQIDENNDYILFKLTNLLDQNESQKALKNYSIKWQEAELVNVIVNYTVN